MERRNIETGFDQKVHQNADVLRTCEQLTGYTFRFAPGSELVQRIGLLANADKEKPKNYSPDRYADGVLGEDWPFHKIGMGGQSAWMTLPVVRYTTDVATCLAGIAINSKGQIKIFHDEASDPRLKPDEIKYGLFMSGLTDPDGRHGNHYREAGLFPLYKSSKDPEYAYVILVVDPLQKEVVLGYVEALSLKETIEDE